MSVSEAELQAWVAANADELEVPGVAAGLCHEGAEQYAFHGVTSLENPLPVDEHTLFQFGSTGKTYTATAIMVLAERGQVSLDATVRTYLPEFRVRDEQVSRDVTVLHLLNHTAGWSGDLMTNTGDGDDALARYVEKMADLEQVTPLGAAVSYNNASLSVAGRIIETLTGQTFEQAMKELILDPLGLGSTYFFMNQIMTRRFAVGHRKDPDDVIRVARPWALPRGNSPAGGMSANAADQIAWARFHLGDGRAPDGSRLLSEDALRRMQEPTIDMPGSALGDSVGISWLMRDIDGVRTVGHGGTTNGQLSEFVMVPERGFALISMTNCTPNGSEFNNRFARWAFESYLGITRPEPEPVMLGDAELQQYAGTYETIAAVVEATPDSGGVLLNVKPKPEVLAQLREAGEDVPEEQPPIRIALLAGTGDRYVVSEGAAKGMTGYFTRDASGAVDGIHVGGRMANRTAAPASV